MLNLYLGLVAAYSKPNLERLFEPITRQLKLIEHGIKVKIEDEVTSVQFFLLTGVFDKPARAQALNSKLCTGFHGCIKCYQSGSSYFRLNKSKF